MAIPPFTEDGLLPLGIHECTREEIEERFGSFHSSDHRPRLFEGLSAYLKEAQAVEFIRWVVVDGSFVTAKETPGDIDIIVVLDPARSYVCDLRPFEANAISHRMIQRTFGLDALVALDDSRTLHEYVTHFQMVRDLPGAKKGVLKVAVR